MAHEEAGRSLQSAGTDGRASPNPGRASPSKERRTSAHARNGDGTDFPRFFLQLGNEFKRTKGYQMIQELQLMVCNKDTGIRGNAPRARVMVLLREVQSILVGLENKVDAQTYDIGVFNVERSELRRELRDEKSKEVQPLHTIDFRSTEVKDLPHKLRTLFEDNQVLREQVRSLQYSVRSGEAKLEAAQRRLAGLEAENASLSMAFRDIGVSPDLALEMRHLREAVRHAEGRVRQAEMQSMALQEQLELERRMLSQQARAHASKQAVLEARLSSALGVTPSTSRATVGIGAIGAGPGSSASSAVGVGVGRKLSGRSAGIDLMASGVVGDDGFVSASFSGRVPDLSPGGGGGSVSGGLYSGGGMGGGSISGMYGTPSLLDGTAGGGGPGADGRSSANSRGPSLGTSGTAGPGGAAPGAGTATAVARAIGGSGRDLVSSPPRSPSGRSISHSPGSVIPSLYPLFNAKPRTTHAFGADSTSWLMSTYGNGREPAAAQGTVASGSVVSASHLPLPAPPSSFHRVPSASNGAGGSGTVGGGGPMGRPGSGLGMEILRPADGAPAAPRPPSAASAAGSTAAGPGESVRAINSTAVVTSRTLLPSVSGASGRSSHGGSAAAAAAGGGGGGGPGILGLKVMMGTGGGSGVLRRTADSASLPGVPDSGLQVLSPDPALRVSASGAGRATGSEGGSDGGAMEVAGPAAVAVEEDAVARASGVGGDEEGEVGAAPEERPTAEAKVGSGAEADAEEVEEQKAEAPQASGTTDAGSD